MGRGQVAFTGMFIWISRFKALVANILTRRQIAIADRQKMEEILGALEDIANLIGRCALYETLYLGKETMAARCEQVIVELYVSILLYLLGAKKYYSKNTTGTSHDCMHSKAAANGSVQCVLWPAHLIRRCSRFWMRLRKGK